MKTLVYNGLRRVASQERRNEMKKRVAHTRRRLAPVYRARHGTFGAADLAAEIGARMPADTEILFVHCSINDLEPTFVGRVDELLKALIEMVGPDRTLAMPAFFFGGDDGDPEAWYREKPLFDARRTPSQMGLLSELFRRTRGVQRSLHPTASITALGPLADELTATHHLADTTFGPGTPFAVMDERRTAIAGLGTRYFRCLTHVHAAEDLMGDRFPIDLRPPSLPVRLKDRDGTSHDYELGINDRRHRRRVEMLGKLMGPDELVEWRFHGAPMFLTDAGRVTEVLIEAAERRETLYDTLPLATGAGRRRPRVAARR
jgi:aminoglycoside 3-N-acetyltransferase